MSLEHRDDDVESIRWAKQDIAQPHRGNHLRAVVSSCITSVNAGDYPHVLEQYYHSCRPPLRRKNYENNSRRICLCNFGERLWQSYVVTKKLSPRNLFCVIDVRLDNRLFHI